jgi:hypothetical protein
MLRRPLGQLGPCGPRPGLRGRTSSIPNGSGGKAAHALPMRERLDCPSQKASVLAICALGGPRRPGDPSLHRHPRFAVPHTPGRVETGYFRRGFPLARVHCRQLLDPPPPARNRRQPAPFSTWIQHPVGPRHPVGPGVVPCARGIPCPRHPVGPGHRPLRPGHRPLRPGHRPPRSGIPWARGATTVGLRRSLPGLAVPRLPPRRRPSHRPSPVTLENNRKLYRSF